MCSRTMRLICKVVIALVAASPFSLIIVNGTAGDSTNAPGPKTCNIIYQEIKHALENAGPCAHSAQLELDYWHDDIWKSANRIALKTKDGKNGEVCFLTAPSMSTPGTDFSMAVLLIDKQAVDWTTCWTHNRTARQKLQLVDVDGDGSVDVAYQASAGWFGLRDKRQHRRPNDKRTWLYAYGITSTGFHSLFPEPDRKLHLTVRRDIANESIKLV